MEGRRNEVLELSTQFALKVISFCEELQERKKFVVANQLLRSGTAIGANIHEAQHAESRADFIHKMKIASKETHETTYWLFLCKESSNYPYDPCLDSMLQSISKLLSRIISSSKKNVLIELQFNF